jgi:ribosomal RNA-processing protein 36
VSTPADRAELKARMAAAARKAAAAQGSRLPSSEDDNSGSDSDSDGAAAEHSSKKKQQQQKDGSSSSLRRANKNRPAEQSSKRAVGRHREVVAVRKRKFRDPRFESVGSGPLNYDLFRKAYGFLETYQDGEIDELKKSLKREKSSDRSAQLHTLLGKLQQERAERKRGDALRAALSSRKRTEAAAVASGKQPYFLKASEKRRVAVEQRYEELKKDGKVAKFVEKKRKKNAAKDHRWLPASRRTTATANSAASGGGDA